MTDDEKVEALEKALRECAEAALDRIEALEELLFPAQQAELRALLRLPGRGLRPGLAPFEQRRTCSKRSLTVRIRAMPISKGGFLSNWLCFANAQL